MARPKKFRKVCIEPKCKLFTPKMKEKSYEKREIEAVKLTVEECEAIRLIDYRDLDQFEAAEKMEVARSTVQRLYKEARFKIADALINAKAIEIGGGQYRLCEDYFIVEECPDCPSQIKQRKRGINLENNLEDNKQK